LEAFAPEIRESSYKLTLGYDINSFEEAMRDCENYGSLIICRKDDRDNNLTIC